jgi:hypothetical protein
MEARGFHDSRTLVDGNPHRDEYAELRVARISYVHRGVRRRRCILDAR